MIHLNFENNLGNSEFTILGSAPVQVDRVTQKTSCYFDGNSFLQLPTVSLGVSDFCISTIFRPDTIGQERGIFGSYGYRLALRQDPRSNSVSFWVHFPSSTNLQRVQFFVDPNTWTTTEHYFGVKKIGNTYYAQLDHDKKQISADHNFWSFTPFLGTYYDKMYGFLGSIRQYRLDLIQDNADDQQQKYTIDSLF